MITRLFFVTAMLALLMPGAASAQNQKPVLRLEAGGPTANVTALAFAPDGNTLYAGGFDKVVRVWRLSAKTNLFELDPTTSFRVPIHPGTQGAINALALSSDGQWLAVGGLGIIREGTSFHDTGRLLPAAVMKPEMRQDQGLIHVFHTQKRELRLLRGHRGPILALTFAPVKPGEPLRLASAARGYDDTAAKKIGELRLWDVDQGKQVAERLDLPVPEDGRSLTVYATGKEPMQACVVTAWMHRKKDNNFTGVLRLWDVEQDEVRTLEEKYNFTAALVPGESTLLSGGFAQGKANVKLWELDGAKATIGRTLDLAAPAGAYPDTLAAFASGPEKPADRVAVILWKGKDNFLQIVDMAKNQSNVRVPLWENNTMAPIVAGSPRGRFLAVGGNPGHTIHVYAIADLLKENINPQVLRSVGASFRFVRFVDKAGKPGLLMSEPAQHDEPGVQQGDVVFDFGERSLAPLKGWNIVGPKLDGWKVKLARADKGVSLTLSQDGEARGKPIVLAPEQRYDTHAMLPPQAPWKLPLVAVASYLVLQGELALDIYDGDTGRKIRRFAGHLAPIRSLAFSADGKLLASAAEDQTVAVWSLTDLPEVLGKFGGIEGLGVEKKGQALVVSQLDPASSAAAVLTKQMTIQGLIDGKNQLKPLDTPYAFYDALWKTKPGQAVTLRVREGDDDAREVQLKVDQGIDVRKPLLSLFITRADKADQREWLGWNAVGPFDSSRADVETLLGWHFNTGLPKEPTRFAAIKEYRDKYYKKSILKHLVDKANLKDALKEWADVNMVLRPVPVIQEGIGAVRSPRNRDLLYHDPKDEDAVHFVVDRFTHQDGDAVEWRIGDRSRSMQPPEGSTWSVPLKEFPDRPGRYRLDFKVTLLDTDGQMREHPRTVHVRYQRPAPKLMLTSSEMPVTRAKYTLRGDVLGRFANHKVTIAILHTDEAGMVTEQPPFTAVLARDRPFELKKDLMLRQGLNRIEVVAKNVDPLEGFEDEEQVTRAFTISFPPPEAPTITFGAIAALLDAKDMSEPVVREPGQVPTVDLPRLRIKGMVKAKDPIDSLAWDFGAKSDVTTLLEKGQDKEVSFDFTVDLRPGPQQIRVLAKVAQGKERIETLPIRYAPALPRVVITAPKRDSTILGDDDKGQISVQASLVQPRNPSRHPFKIEVEYLSGGEKVHKDVQSTAQVLPEQKLVLQPGNNNVQVRLKSDWSTDESPAGVVVRYARPPKIVAIEHEVADKAPFANLTVQVASALPPLADKVRVEVEGKPAKFATAKVMQKNAKDREWTIEVREVPLVVDENRVHNENFIEVSVANAEAVSNKSVKEKVVFKGKAPPRPEIVVAPYAVPKEPELELRFQVESKRPLKRVEVSNGSRVLFRPEGDLSQLKPSAEGVYEFATGIMALEWGLNPLTVEATNDGGSARKFEPVTIPEVPVQVDFDTLVVEGDDGTKTVKGVRAADGKVTFDKVADGKVTLQGRIRWSSKDDADLKGAHRVQIYVNGFQQFPGTLLPAVKGQRERQFKAPLSLSWHQNQVKVVLPDLKKDINSRLEFAVACTKPVTGQQVHVVIVAPGERDSKVLKDRFLKTFGPKLGLDAVRIHPLTGHVLCGHVLTRLDNIAGLLKSRAVLGLPNDLVLVYYWGSKSDLQGENYFWTSETEADAVKASALGLDELADKYFARFPGAQLLLLDVFPPQAGKMSGDRWKSDYRFGILGCLNDTRPSFRYPLLGALEKTMPDASWLHELVAPLQKSLGKDTRFVPHVPPGLRVQLDPVR